MGVLFRFESFFFYIVGRSEGCRFLFLGKGFVGFRLRLLGSFSLLVGV